MHVIENPLRALMNSERIGTSPATLGALFDAVVSVMEIIVECDDDDELLEYFYDSKLEIFDQALLADWEAHQLTMKQRTLDKKKVCALPLILARMRETMESDNWDEMKAHVAKQTRLWAKATTISYMRNATDYLAPDGKYSAANQDAQTTRLLRVLAPSNDGSEWMFALMRSIKASSPTLHTSALIGVTTARLTQMLAAAPPPPKYEHTKFAAKGKVAATAHRTNELALRNLKGGEAAQLAAVVVATRRAPRCTTLAEALAAGAGASVAQLHSESDVAALKAALYARRISLVNAKQTKVRLAHEGIVAIFAEHEYESDPRALCRWVSSSSKAVELLSAQLKLVLAMGWRCDLFAHDSTLDFTVGQTSSKPVGIEAHKDALLHTLKRISAAVTALELTVQSEPPLPPNIYRDLPSLGDDSARRREFREEQAAIVARIAKDAQRADPLFERLEKKFTNERFYDPDRGGGNFLITKLCSSKEHGDIVAECPRIDLLGNDGALSPLKYFGAPARGELPLYCKDGRECLARRDE